MSGYVASARIVRAAPRLARARRAMDRGGWVPAGEPAEIQIVDGAAAGEAGPTFVERYDAFRERWGQLTFFLFDANSWR
jgi:hypothetical protein